MGHGRCRPGRRDPPAPGTRGIIGSRRRRRRRGDGGVRRPGPAGAVLGGRETRLVRGDRSGDRRRGRDDAAGPDAGAGHRGRVVLDAGRRHVDRGHRVHVADLARPRRHRRGLHHRPVAVGCPRRDGPGPRGGRGGVRAGGRPPVPGRAVGGAVGDDADPAAMAGPGLAPAARVDRPDALYDARQPAGAPARLGRGRARVPLVRPRARTRPGGEPTRRRGRHRVPRLDRPRPAGRPGGVRLEPVLGGRAPLHDDDEPDEPHPGLLRDPADRGALRREARRLRPQHVPDGRRGHQGTVPGPPAATEERRTAGPAVLDVRPPAGREQRGAPGPEHGRGGPGDAARHTQHLRRLRRLRRGGPPRRGQPDRGAARAPGARRGAGGAREDRRTDSAALPLRRAVRPRPVPGGRLRGDLRDDALDAVRGAVPREGRCCEGPVESWGRVEPLLDDLAGEDASRENAAGRAASRVHDRAASAGGPRAPSRRI